MPSSARGSSYVKENDVKFGLSVTSRVMHTGVVNGLRCRFCVAFGREERVGSKRKGFCPTSQQSWVFPFRYDNIENHVRTQHPSKWDEYETAKLKWKYATRYDECNNFFAHTNTLAARSNFWSPEQPGRPQQARPQLVFTIDKDIVECIIGEMMYSSTDHDDDDGVLAELDGGDSIEIS